MRTLLKCLIISLLLLNTHASWAAKLAIVIDDFGYRQHSEEQIISFSPNITVAVLPHAPNAKRMATFAHNHGNDVIIHLPMAPVSKQPLEVDTLFPYMDENEVHRIITNAVERVPYAIGVNNHMGSLMTSNLAGMQRVMKALAHYSLFFLDSKTIGKTQVKEAAKEQNIPVVVRDVFLDDEQTENAIAHQFDLAVTMARKNGHAIAIGHPYPQTVNVLRSKLSNLPADIELIKVSQLVSPLPTKPKVTLKGIWEKYKRQFEEARYLYMLEN